MLKLGRERGEVREDGVSMGVALREKMGKWGK